MNQASRVTPVAMPLEAGEAIMKLLYKPVRILVRAATSGKRA